MDAHQLARLSLIPSVILSLQVDVISAVTDYEKLQRHVMTAHKKTFKDVPQTVLNLFPHGFV